MKHPRFLNLILPAILLYGCGSDAPPTTPATAKPSAPTVVPIKPTTPVAPVGIKPVDVPAGFGYPGDRTQMQAWADTWAIAQITTTAWDLWAGMTRESGQSWQGASLPVWETWCGNEEVFGAGCKTLNDPAKVFKRATQLNHTALKMGLSTPADTQVVSFNKFNPAMADYLAQQHAGPANASYDYTSQQSLVNLNAAWPDGTPITDRKIQETPYQPATSTSAGFSAIETKPVVFLVKASGLTPMPLWQGPTGAKPGSQNNAVPESWLTCVLLDPANSGGSDSVPIPATAEQIATAVPNALLSCQTYLYAPLSTIYSFKLNAAEAAAFNTLAPQSGDGSQGAISAAAGDYAVLAAMHVNSKSIVNWTWQTFWWQPGADAPDNFPGSKQGMTANVLGAWRNYAMCSSWNQTKGAESTEMVVCFNPYLETSTGIPAGQSSNCMSCHGVASAGAAQVTQGNNPPNAITTLSYPPAYTAPIDFQNDPRFADFTRTDFSWAIPSDARNDLPQPQQ